MSFASVPTNWMSDGAIAWIGLVFELVAARAYLAAASRGSARGSRWPIRRTTAFLAGLLVIALALDSGIAAHDDVPSVHMLQHALLMMLAPMLLALSAPITLAMRTMSSPGRRRLLAVLHDPSVRGLATRPGLLIADYNVTMAIVLAAPIYHLADQHVAIHIAEHVYLVFCGLLFWTAILARGPVPKARSRPVRRPLHPAKPRARVSRRARPESIHQHRSPRSDRRRTDPGGSDHRNQPARNGDHRQWQTETSNQNKSQAPLKPGFDPLAAGAAATG